MDRIQPEKRKNAECRRSRQEMRKQTVQATIVQNTGGASFKIRIQTEQAASAEYRRSNLQVKNTDGANCKFRAQTDQTASSRYRQIANCQFGKYIQTEQAPSSKYRRSKLQVQNTDGASSKFRIQTEQVASSECRRSKLQVQNTDEASCK